MEVATESVVPCSIFSLFLEFNFGRLQQGVLNFQDSYNKSYRYLIYRENRVSSEEI